MKKQNILNALKTAGAIVFETDRWLSGTRGTPGVHPLEAYFAVGPSGRGQTWRLQHSSQRHGRDIWLLDGSRAEILYHAGWIQHFHHEPERRIKIFAGVSWAHDLSFSRLTVEWCPWAKLADASLGPPNWNKIHLRKSELLPLFYDILYDVDSQTSPLWNPFIDGLRDLGVFP